MIERDCPFCHHDRATLVRPRQKEKYSDRVRDVYRCDECGLLYPETRMDAAEAAAYAAWVSAHWAKSYDYDTTLGRVGRRECLYRLIRSRVPAGGRALDIGTSTGQFCHVLNTLGFEAYGIDPDPNAVAIARRNGLKVYQGAFPDEVPVEVREGGYQLVTINECAGFFVDMREAFGLLHRMVAPGGHLLIKMAQATSAFYDDPGKSLFNRHGDSIQAFHTGASLRHILTRSGFEVLILRAYPGTNLKHRFGWDVPRLLGKLGTAIEHAYSAWLLDLGRADRVVVLGRKPRAGSVSPERR